MFLNKAERPKTKAAIKADEKEVPFFSQFSIFFFNPKKLLIN